MQQKIAKSIKAILTQIGEDPRREGLVKTPKRYAKALEYLTSGYQASVDKIVNKAIFQEKTEDLVLVRDIELFSLCEHHLLPFYGKAHVAYVPNGKIIGLSKIPRIVNVFARRLQVQERITNQIAAELMRVIQPHGVAVIIEAYHMCMMMRGVEKKNSFTVTNCMLGNLKTDPQVSQQFFSLLEKTRAQNDERDYSPVSFSSPKTTEFGSVL